MHTVLIVIHVITCLLLVGVVLLQQGRGADMGAVFGGGSSSTVFGSSGAGNFLTRLTAGLATVFMLTAAGLTYMGAYRVTGTVFDEALPEPPPLEAPAAQSQSTGAPAVAPEAAPQGEAAGAESGGAAAPAAEQPAPPQ
ncbi:MAG: preprotein translocase subunit SecG [Candidatus Binatia bacterium]|nr:preprotein translocase subunit SecG [Candidatus Binatia bacterium]